VNRGDVVDVELPGGRHPAVIVTRDRAIPYLTNVCVAAVTTTIRELPTEVPLGREHGLKHESVVNCDNLFTLPKRSLSRRRGTLDPEQSHRLNAALRVALELD
jgi:mRNA interferase MazF